MLGWLPPSPLLPIAKVGEKFTNKHKAQVKFNELCLEYARAFAAFRPNAVPRSLTRIWSGTYNSFSHYSTLLLIASQHCIPPPPPNYWIGHLRILSPVVSASLLKGGHARSWKTNRRILPWRWGWEPLGQPAMTQQKSFIMCLLEIVGVQN